MAENGIPNEEEDEYRVSIRALRTKTKTLISSLLNPIKIIPTENGLPRDWLGLAELIGIGGEKIPHLQRDLNPTVKLFDLWLEKEKDNSTIRKLLDILEQLDRFDVIDDIKELLDEDIKVYKEKLEKGEITTLNIETDKFVLTVDDVKRINQGLEPQNYDAFVLFADDDIDFATELIETMEKQKNLKFCVKERDLVGGAFEHEVIIKLIAERCNRLIVIISPAFLKSPANKFFVNFAQAIGIDQRQRKIIPCIYSQCEIPVELKCYFMLDYKRTGKLWNFWDKLYDSIRTPEKEVTKRPNLNRAMSHQVPMRPRNYEVRSAIPIENGLRAKKDGVKFNSMVNLNEVEGISSDIKASTSGNGIVDKKNKNKVSWIKKLLPSKSSKNNANENLQEKEKRKFWQRHSKRKVAVAN